MPHNGILAPQPTLAVLASNAAEGISSVAKFLVPPSLDPPQVAYEDGVLRITPTVASTMQDAVEYRWKSDS